MENEKTFIGKSKYSDVVQSLTRSKDSERLKRYYEQLITDFRGTTRPEVFPITKNTGKVCEVFEKETARCLDANMHKGVSPKGYFEKRRRNIIAYKSHRADQIRESKISPCLTKNMGDGGNNVPMVQALRNLNRNGRLTHSDGYVGSIQTSGNEEGVWTENLQIRDGRDNRSCLRSGRTPELGVPGMSLRRLTPIECERLQGFPDNWTQIGINEQGEVVKISDTQRYKMMGNAVTTNVVQAVMERLHPQNI